MLDYTKLTSLWQAYLLISMPDASRITAGNSLRSVMSNFPTKLGKGKHIQTHFQHLITPDSQTVKLLVKNGRVVNKNNMFA